MRLPRVLRTEAGRPAATLLTLVAIAGSLWACAPGQSADDDPSQALGRELYRDQGCGGCHGPAGEGRRTAPALSGLKAHWSEQTLVSYLENPDQLKAETLRLRQLAESYVVHMPPARTTDQDELRSLARFLLSW